MSKVMNIGMIGLDTSHCEAFTKLLNDASHPYHVPGGKVIVGYPGGSDDFEMSYGRVEKFTAALRDEHGLTIVDSPEAVAEQADAILLTSVDGRIHSELFQRIVSYGKPVFIDKPFAVTTEDAKQMAQMAKKHGVPLMSASSLRYAQALVDALNDTENGAIFGVDAYGPMAIQETQGGLFWYGIHSVEMIYRVLGAGCEYVTATTNEDHEFVIGVWKDGRIGTVRGNRKGNNEFGATIHRENGSQYVNASRHPKPLYAGLMEDAMQLFKSGKGSVELEETIEIVRFLEAANESRETGKTVKL